MYVFQYIKFNTNNKPVEQYMKNDSVRLLFSKFCRINELANNCDGAIMGLSRRWLKLFLRP